MPFYNVDIDETLSKTIKIEASSPKEALVKAGKLRKNKNFTLEFDDLCCDTKITVNDDDYNVLISPPISTINELSELMIEKRLTIRAIPRIVRVIHEVKHKDLPQLQPGRVEFLREYGREMFIHEKRPTNGGKFLIVQNCGTSSMISFQKQKFYDTLGDAIASIVGK